MHFDDRLDTVMRLPATNRSIARIQYRQLIDLLGTSATGEIMPAQLQAAFTKLDDLAAIIPATQRAALLREPTTRLTNPAFIAHLAAAEPDIASAAIGSAALSQADWIALIPTLPIRARGILRHRRDLGPAVEAVLERLGIGDRGLPPADVAAVEPTPVTPARPQRPELIVLEGGAGNTARSRSREEPSMAGIGAIVRQIEAFRSTRTDPSQGDTASSPSNDTAIAPRTMVPALDFTTDAAGRVDWADGPLASGLVGALMNQQPDPALRNAMRHQQPLRGLTVKLHGAPALTGTWRLDALPRFSPAGGQFLGYAGRLRRSSDLEQQMRAAPSPAADSMREVLHELRTPANAIQVAAEIIQQQLYGPAPHEYRALAAAIAGDTAQILAGFDELDRLARLESGALSTAGGTCDLSALVIETVTRLRAWTAPRESGFSLPAEAPEAMAAMDHVEAAKLVWRLLAAIAGLSARGEVSRLAFASDAGTVSLVIDLPGAVAERLDQTDGPDRTPELARSLSSGIFGIGFTMRLAAAEAAAAGGRLIRDGARIMLVLPGLTHALASHTQA